MSIINSPIALTILAMKKLAGQPHSKDQLNKLAICYQCNDRSEICPECGCVCQAKVLMKNETCPLNKWPTT
jgi:hypothetical protein